jgi:DNA-binding IscR family transcriptional regulator
MNSSRFSISIHILTLLARAGDELLSSDHIAGSVNINRFWYEKKSVTCAITG